MKLYVASSWPNVLQQAVVHTLRAAGHEVYDFKQPMPEAKGFGSSEVDPEWKAWVPERFRECLSHPVAVKGFDSDLDAMKDADACILVLPCGRSAHLEAGYFVGAGKPLYVLMIEQQEPELMYHMATRVLVSMDELFDAVGLPAHGEAPRAAV